MVPCIKSIDEHRHNIKLFLEKGNHFGQINLHDREGLFMPIYENSEICPNVRNVEIINERGVYVSTIIFDEKENIKSITLAPQGWINEQWVVENCHTEIKRDQNGNITSYKLVENNHESKS